MLTENGGTRSRTGGLSVALAGSDGHVLGGGVAGMLMAATPVQVGNLLNILCSTLLAFLSLHILNSEPCASLQFS